MHRFLLTLLVLPLSSFAATYYVTQPGGGNQSGTSSGNPFSLAGFNASTKPTGGDTVIFTGTFTGTVAPATGGTGNGAARLTLNMTGATLVSAPVRIQINNKSYLNINGGTMGPSYNGVMIAFQSTASISHDCTINGWTYTGQAGGISIFLSLNHCWNTVISNNTVDNVSSFVIGDSTLNHDTDITGNFARTSTDTSSQDDLIKIGDAYNITIEKNKLIGQAPASPAFQHNDIIQNYTKGGGNAGSPYNWIIRYNWIEMQQRSGSGDCSWLMLQSMSGAPAIKIYGNVFLGTGTIGNNGVCVGRNNGGSYYFYNNTVVRNGDPDNTVRFANNGTSYIENNVATTSAGVYGTLLVFSMVQGKCDYNFWYGAGGPSASPAFSGPHGSDTVNPLFVNAAGGNFALQSSSSLRGKGDRSIGAEFSQGIKAGSTWPNPTLTPRNTWDIGAFNQ
jgi:hypothetical protein